MRVKTLILSAACIIMAGSAYAQTAADPVNPGPAIQGNSDPAMPMKAKKMPMKKHMKPMHKKKMM